MGIDLKVSHMENKSTLLIVEGSGTVSPRRSPVRSRSNLSRSLTSCRGESGGGATGSLSRRHGMGACSPSLKTVCGDASPRIATGYTSLSDLTVTVPTASFMRSDSFGTTATTNSPRTPLRDALVEKAVRAYLQPSESFQARNRRSRWGVCLFSNDFFSNFFAKFASSIPNPLKFFCSSLKWIGLYFTGTDSEVNSSWN
ncbi:hypothetical protein R1sor_020226 [Riccia sorocarpa]|uniref:Uncharacterized protein n=1 Tax=Riccia sorocarpa TaxID=122646 RepID=A0ABD3IGE6_9MARC